MFFSEGCHSRALGSDPPNFAKVQLEDIFPEFKPIPPDRPMFWMAQYPVTNRQFQEFLVDIENSHWRPDSDTQILGMTDASYLHHWKKGGCPQHLLEYPVTNVSWHAAHAYTHWFRKHYRQPIRLPTIVEWEIAARAGRMQTRWWQEALSNSEINCQNTSGRLTRVDAFEPNPYKVSGLLGNIYELCSSVDDNHGIQVAGCGGAYHTLAEDCIKAIPLLDSECRPDVGFRCVLEYNDPL